MQTTKNGNCQTWGIDHLMNEVLNSNINDLIQPRKEFIQRTPPVNILESSEFVRIELAVPGMKREDIKIQIENAALTISADHKREVKENEKFKSSQFGFTKFKKTFKIPRTIDFSKISAKMEDGILHVKMMKSEETQARNIDIS